MARREGLHRVPVPLPALLAAATGVRATGATLRQPLRHGRLGGAAGRASGAGNRVVAGSMDRKGPGPDFLTGPAAVGVA